MAEWGKGDDRWLVENRQDGTNVNQWHWSEKDCLPWSRARLTELFEGAVLVSGSSGVAASVTAVDSVEGEAFLNVRKKKLIPSYELAVKLSFSAEVEQAGGKETVTGKVLQQTPAIFQMSLARLELEATIALYSLMQCSSCG